MKTTAVSSWNLDRTGLAFAVPKSLRAALPFPTLLTSLEIAVSVNGRDLAPDSWTPLPDGTARAEVAGHRLGLSIEPETGAVAASFTNGIGVSVRLGGFRFRARARDGKADFLSIPGPRLRLFKEGWAMTSAAGSVRYGDRDFVLNPDYLPFSVSSPKKYDTETPNRFSAESAVVLNDAATGSCLLLGAISSADQVVAISVELDASGISRLEAFAHGDGTLVAPGETVRSEEIVVLAGTNGSALLEEFADLLGKRMNAISWPSTPTGWCSWPYYSWHVTEQAIAENASWLGRHRETFPIDYLQIDDGYQAALGDWLRCDEAKFPSGLEALAGTIRKEGLKPGLWVAPFLVDESSRLFAEHRDWMVKDRSGEPVRVMRWRDTSPTFVLDCTLPAVCAWLTETFAALGRLGYEYFKLDFLVHECSVLALGGVYADPRTTRIQALRRGLAAIRKGAGDRFLLGCTNALGAGIGLVNGCRISSDISTYWEKPEERHYKEAPSVPNVCRNVIGRRYMHGRLWLNDPDTHLAGDDRCTLTADEIRLWTTALRFAGGMLLFGDRFETLSPEQTALSRSLLRDLDAFDSVRPLDLFGEEIPPVWIGSRKESPGKLSLACFNFGDAPRTFRIDPASLGLEPRETGKAVDFREGADLGKIAFPWEIAVPAHGCRVFEVTSGE